MRGFIFLYLKAKQTENAVTGSSLFSGMTLTSLPATAAHEELSLLGHSNSTPSKQLSSATEAAAAITKDFPTVLGNFFKQRQC